ncbi:TPA: methyl-accepting chemotaxis protein, partial [Burkholderia territorii]|nr:methyl-accepting chemotaxis protein [Burkholderia territorii]
ASHAGQDAKRAPDAAAARASKEAPAAGGYGPRLAKAAAAPAPKPAEKPALVRPALNGEKPAMAAAGTSDDDWETF